MARDSLAEAIRQLELLHADCKRRFENAAELQAKGRMVPASKLREREQTTAWSVSKILELVKEANRVAR